MKKNKTKRKSKFRTVLLIISVVMFISGLCVLLYPTANDIRNDIKTSLDINSFDEKYSDAQGGDTQISDNLSRLKTAFEEYHLNLSQHGQNLSDPFDYENPDFDLTEYGMTDNMIGYLDIPRLDLNISIRLGASKANMNYGAVHLSKTSMPIGGNSTNCVIAAHRGWNGMKMFKHIDKMQLGDDVYLHNPWGTLHYKVVDIEIIAKDDIQKIMIQKDRDMLTLFTCHPYRVNTHRYTVYCERAED